MKDLCKRYNMTDGAVVLPPADKFGGMDVAEVCRLKELELENERLKRLIAE